MSQADFVAWILRAAKHLGAMASQWTLATRPNTVITNKPATNK